VQAPGILESSQQKLVRYDCPPVDYSGRKQIYRPLRSEWVSISIKDLQFAAEKLVWSNRDLRIGINDTESNDCSTRMGHLHG
jgi:hypothetical protein